jgi:hypothetical protein
MCATGAMQIVLKIQVAKEEDARHSTFSPSKKIEDKGKCIYVHIIMRQSFVCQNRGCGK